MHKIMLQIVVNLLKFIVLDVFSIVYNYVQNYKIDFTYSMFEFIFQKNRQVCDIY